MCFSVVQNKAYNTVGDHYIYQPSLHLPFDAQIQFMIISFVNNTLGDCCYLFTILLLPFGNTIHNTLSITSVVHPQFMFFLAVVFITMFPPSAVKIGRPGYTVTKQYDPDTKQHSFLFEVSIHCVRISYEIFT